MRIKQLKKLTQLKRVIFREFANREESWASRRVTRIVWSSFQLLLLFIIAPKRHKQLMSPETFSINTTDILIYIFSFQIIAHSITALQRQKREELEPIFTILTQKQQCRTTTKILLLFCSISIYRNKYKWVLYKISMKPPECFQNQATTFRKGCWCKIEDKPSICLIEPSELWDRLGETYLQKSDQKELCKDGRKGQIWQC